MDEIPFEELQKLSPRERALIMSQQNARRFIRENSAIDRDKVEQWVQGYQKVTPEEQESRVYQVFETINTMAETGHFDVIGEQMEYLRQVGRGLGLPTELSWFAAAFQSKLWNEKRRTNQEFYSTLQEMDKSSQTTKKQALERIDQIRHSENIQTNRLEDKIREAQFLSAKVGTAEALAKKPS